jgi:hypothetical protein
MPAITRVRLSGNLRRDARISGLPFASRTTRIRSTCVPHLSRREDRRSAANLGLDCRPRRNEFSEPDHYT